MSGSQRPVDPTMSGSQSGFASAPSHSCLDRAKLLRDHASAINLLRHSCPEFAEEPHELLSYLRAVQSEQPRNTSESRLCELAEQIVPGPL